MIICEGGYNGKCEDVIGSRSYLRFLSMRLIW